MVKPHTLQIVSLIPDPSASSNASAMLYDYRPSQPPSPADWKEFRPFLSKLYLKEGKPLTQVQHILAEEYGFKASQVQLMTIHSHLER
jgi:hypothetical protein